MRRRFERSEGGKGSGLEHHPLMLAAMHVHSALLYAMHVHSALHVHCAPLWSSLPCASGGVAATSLETASLSACESVSLSVSDYASATQMACWCASWLEWPSLSDYASELALRSPTW